MKMPTPIKMCDIPLFRSFFFSASVRVSAFFRCFRRGRTSFFFPQKKFFLLVLNLIDVEPGALRASGRGPPAELSRLTVFRETEQVRNSRYVIFGFAGSTYIRTS